MPAPDPDESAVDPALVPDAHSARFFNFFAWYTRRLIARRFAAVRAAPGTTQTLRALADDQGPVVMAMTHSSWWDPLIGVYLHDRFTPARRSLGPIDARELARFRFMRKLGLFGIDPDNPRVIDSMTRYIAGVCRDAPHTTLWITPQGTFQDVRAPMLVRPGAAAAAARLRAVGPCRVVSLAIELAFWNDQRPEIFLRADPVAADRPHSMPSWHRAISRAMRAGAEALSTLVIARDPQPFETLLGGDARIHPVYDAILKLRGKSGGLGAARRTEAAP
ncbi:MAG: lysophospholipid acyltransferase family protein [Planctomycetota bacterium]|nr:lysophospholipid acyltransferase family protein [Planctomycetota bacterium]